MENDFIIGFLVRPNLESLKETTEGKDLNTLRYILDPIEIGYVFLERHLKELQNYDTSSLTDNQKLILKVSIQVFQNAQELLTRANRISLSLPSNIFGNDIKEVLDKEFESTGEVLTQETFINFFVYLYRTSTDKAILTRGEENLKQFNEYILSSYKDFKEFENANKNQETV